MKTSISILIAAVSAVVLPGGCSTKTVSTPASVKETAPAAESTAAASVQPVQTDALTKLRQKTAEHNSAAAIIDLGYTDRESPDLSDYDQWQAELQAYPFIGEKDKVHEVKTNAPYNAFCIVPADSDAEIHVYDAVLSADGTLQQGNELFYSTDGIPILIRCMFADGYGSVLITIISADGSVIRYNPYYSGKDGSLILTDANGNSLHNATIQ